MDLPKIISFLDSEFRRHGADLVSMADLRSLGVIESSLNTFDITDDATHAIAWISAVVPGADRVAVRAAYGGDAAELLERLVPVQVIEKPPPALGRLPLWARWAEATKREDATLRAVATALLSAERTKISDTQGMDFLELLKDPIESAKRAGRERIYELLTELRDNIAANQQARPEATPNRPLLISLSIDVAGSTEAKAGLRKLAADDTQRDRLYRLFYKSFLDQEGRLLGNLFARGAGERIDPPLDWHRLFVIKGIGDELWMTYDVSNASGCRAEADAEIGRAAVRLVNAALDLVTTRTVSFLATDRDTGPSFGPAVEETLQFLPVKLPFKVTMDLIEDAVEISDLRMAHLTPRAGSYLVADQCAESGQTPSTRWPFGADHVEILNRLNAGTFALVGGHRVRQVYRTDLVSNDVDRFFRIAKEALPGCVMLGESLFKRLKFAPATQAAPGISKTEMLFASDSNRIGSLVTTSTPILSMATEIPAKDMKGIEAPYTVCHVITLLGLRLLLHHAEHNKLFRPLVKKRSAKRLRQAAGLPARRRPRTKRATSSEGR